MSGTIDSAKKYNVSPATALDSKAFSHTYWRWQHSLLLDAVAQFGFPTLFITLTANEWHFPKHEFFRQRCDSCYSCPTNDAFSKTMCIVHTLQQFCSQYICGSASQFNNHLLANKRHKSSKNVLAFFHRLEFQNRGTPHIHLLVWLRHLSQIDIGRFSAHVPSHNITLAFNVHHLQKSHKPLPSFVVVREEANAVDESSNTLLLQHSTSDHSCGIRPYVDTINYALRSNMTSNALMVTTCFYDMLAATSRRCTIIS